MRISRSKIELFLECPRCFYAEVKWNNKRPPGFPFTLNNAVDILLKREFDVYREQGKPHPIQEDSGFIPAVHNDLDRWRSPTKGGISYFHKKYNCTYFGAIDDLWVNSTGMMAVTDYKATARDSAVTDLPEWAFAYKRQLSFYNFLFRKNGFRMSEKGFLVYMTALTSLARFNSSLTFVANLIEVDLDETWIVPVLESLHETIHLKHMPEKSPNCRYCRFIDDRISIDSSPESCL
jgi:hypothetical protein